MINKSLLICIPHNYPSHEPAFFLSLISLICNFYENKSTLKNEYNLNLTMRSAPDIATMRNFLAKDIIELKADYALWLDADMTFPPNMIIKMLQHFEEEGSLEAVTGLYVWKEPPFLPHAYYRFNTDTEKFKIACGFPVDKPLRVAGAGFGCIMMDAKVLKRMKYPYFKMDIAEDRISYGEDLYFCKKAKMTMIMDPKLACGHIGKNEFNINHYLAANGLTVKDNVIEVTDEQRQSIEDKHISKL